MDDKILTVLDDPVYVRKMDYRISALGNASKTGGRYLVGTVSDFIDIFNRPFGSMCSHPLGLDIPEEENRKKQYKEAYDISVNIRDKALKILKEKNLLCPMNQEVIGYKKCVILNKEDFNRVYCGWATAIHEVPAATGNLHLVASNGYHGKPNIQKLTYVERSRALECIVTLKIPKSAKRIQPFSNSFKWFDVPSAKCRTNRAKVLSIEDLDGNPIELNDNEICVSMRSVYGLISEKYKDYKVGHWIYEKDLNSSILIECASGIAFFTNKNTAKEYNYT